jgi:hypothetical protein
MATKARTAADFKHAHDVSVIVPTKIKAGLAAMLKIGPEHFEYDEGFRALCGLQASQLAVYRDQFKQHWFVTPGRSSNKGGKRVWFGNAKVAAKLRASLPDNSEG